MTWHFSNYPHLVTSLKEGKDQHKVQAQSEQWIKYQCGFPPSLIGHSRGSQRSEYKRQTYLKCSVSYDGVDNTLRK